MPTYVKVGGVWELVTAIFIKTAGVWKQTVVNAKDAGSWKEVHAITPVSISATNVSDNENGFSTDGWVPSSGYKFTITTVSNGVGPFTYLWEKQTDATGDDFIIESAIAKHAGWKGWRPDGAGDDIETWRVTVTDEGDGDNTAQYTIDIDLRWVNIS